MADKDGMELRDYLRVLRRRKGALTLGLLATIALVALVVALMPVTYRSTATVQIERRAVPDEWLSGGAVGTPNERIYALTQRITSEENLRAIAVKYPVFEPGWDRDDAWLEAMREAITVDKVDIEVADIERGRAVLTTVAFNVSFDGRTPEVAHQVAAELAALYLQDNELRHAEAAAVVAFLRGEAQRVGTRVDELEHQLSEFRGQNLENLPELAAANRNQYERTLAEMTQIREAIRGLERERIRLGTLLAGTPPDGDVYTEEGRTVVSTGQERLRLLRTQLQDALTHYTAEHPDVQILQSEIAALERKLAGTAPAPTDSVAPTNPAYIALQGELASVESDLRTRRTALAQLQQSVTEYEQRLSASPAIANQYQNLVRAHESVSLRYQEITGRLMEAQMALELAGQQVGDRFYLTRPANFPRKPQNPSPLALMMFGTVLGLGSGVGAAAFSEYWDRSVRGRRGMRLALNYPPLAVMPFVENRAEANRRSRRRWIFALALIGLLALPLYLWLDRAAPWADDDAWLRSWLPSEAGVSDVPESR